MQPDFSRWRWPWHRKVNAHAEMGEYDKKRFMYSAMDAREEAERLPKLFAMERAGTLPETHRQCSHSESGPIEANHLTCCLGVECAKCEHLLAIETDELTPDQQDEAKAWTCVAHVITEGQKRFFDDSEGYVVTVGDRMFWERVYDNLSSASP